MLFHTIDFAVFLPIVFLIYWFVANRNLRIQNLMVVIASYVFYGWWDWKFLSLILLSTLADYTAGILLMGQRSRMFRKLVLLGSILINLGLLGFFKYFNFFIENFAAAFTLLGMPFHAGSLQIVLPVGISFYTFQTMSYTLDVYRRRLEPTRDFIAFSAFVSFFPQLVAGPVERATNLLPQFFHKREFHYDRAVDGMRQILWGLVKKVVIADNCAEYVNEIFAGSGNLSGSTLVLGGVLFAFQIYGDFSGYSDIAIGTARLFGFSLMRNFNFPYFSRDIAEFWRRWHISLSTWFRDYLYIPLGGSRGSKVQNLRNVLIVFVVSGLWHGANWTFVVWGALHALFFLPLLLAGKNRTHLGTVSEGRILPTAGDLLRMTFTFGLTVFAWIFFRADHLDHAFSYISRIFSLSLFTIPEVLPKTLVITLPLFILTEWYGREGQYAIEGLTGKLVKPYRYAVYLILIVSLFWFGGREQQFIYFQF